MVRFRQLLNPLILNEGWIGFQGDSEFKGEDGELHMGYWSFLGILDDAPTDNDWELDDEIEEGLFLAVCKGWKFKVVNDHRQVCAVEFHYGGE